MEKKLPKNWVTDKLFNVVQPVGTNVKKYVGEKEYFSTGSISKEIVPEGIYDFQKKPSRANREVKLNDVLQARMKATNKSFLITENFENSLFSTGFMQFRSYGFTVLPKFIFYYLNSQEFLKAKDDLSTGATQQSINDANAKKIDFPLPPLPEQERIVAKLDLLFAQHEKMKIALEKIPQLLKDFRQQILTQAVTGKLTEEWRKGKDLGEWESYKLEDVSKIIDTHPSHRTPPEVIDGVPYIGMGDISNNGIIDLENARKVSPMVLDEHIKRYQLKEGDIIFGKIGTIGKPVKVNPIQNYCISPNVILIQPNNDIVRKEFLFYYLDSEIFIKKVLEKAVATSQSAFGIKKMRAELILLAEFSEQTEIVSRVESLFSKIDAIELRYQKLKEKIDQFPQTILHKAFKGELVPQLPTDGDAKDLLKEILALKK